MSDNTNNNSALVFAAGVLAGGIGALLFAPQSGRETRGQIQHTAQDAVDTGREKVGDAADQVARSTRRAKNTVNESASGVGEAARDRAEAVREALDTAREAYEEELKERQASSS